MEGIVEVDPLAVDDVWELEARPELLARGALAWRAVGDDARAARDALERAAAPVFLGGWEGEAADGYRAHLRQLTDGLDEIGRAAQEAAAGLDGAAALLRNGQDQLDRAWAAVAVVEHHRGAGAVTFRPADDGQAGVVRAGIAEAVAIRGDVESGLGGHQAALGRARAAWELLAGEWAAVVSGVLPGWVPPPAVGGVETRLVDGMFVVQTGAGDDQVLVADGVVSVGGVRLDIPAGARLVLRTAGGADYVRVYGDAGVTVLAGEGDDRIYGGRGDDVLIAGAGADRVVAGAGNDRVSLGALGYGRAPVAAGAYERASLGDGDDRLWGSLGNEEDSGGAGDDVLVGGEGNDRVTGDGGDDVLVGGADRDYLDGGDGDDVLDGGGGADTLYGLGGADDLRGGAGEDYLEGGDGDDRLDGAAGADVVSGGRGADAMGGGDGDDVLYAGEGRDTVDGGAGADTLYGQAGDDVREAERLNDSAADERLIDFVDVEGDPAYQERVRADLRLMAASPQGRTMLADLRATGVPLRIVETIQPNGYAAPGPEAPVISYNPSYDSLRGSTPPVVVLFHEMAHVYDYDHGTRSDLAYNGGDDRFADGRAVPNFERQAVGLPIDDDGDPGTPNEVDRRHPLAFTENGLRAEMGLPRRDHYAG